MFKKVYIEITNNCNLSCDFCIRNNRSKKFMSMEEFKLILKKLKGHTKYLYFHILGEPTFHPKINALINEASKDFYVNITTNGYLIDKIALNKNIRQLNISLHSFNSKYNITVEKYLQNIFFAVDNLKNHTFISYRFWVNNKDSKKMIEMINEHHHTNITLNSKDFKIEDNVFISISKEFIWPSLENKYFNEIGTCYALKDHIGILVDGTIVPCCLDSEGIINLGNIFNEKIDDVMKKEVVINMQKGFKSNKKTEELCKRCKFL
ncbi:MAG: radical SAM protein [Bacilli bacterium]